MVQLVIGSDALSQGRATRYTLRADYRRIIPDVYPPKRSELALIERTTAAWLWSRRSGVVVGAAASALHGAQWVGRSVAIELNFANNRAPSPVVSRKETLLDDEVTTAHGMLASTVDRTVFDLARRGPVGKAVERRGGNRLSGDAQTYSHVVYLSSDSTQPAAQYSGQEGQMP